MRILVIGGDGMLGHELLAGLSTSHEVAVTLRRHLPAYAHYGLFSPANAFAGVNVRDAGRVLEAVADFQPQAIVNAAGIVKQRADAGRAIPSIEVNSLFPHRLAVMARAAGARLVHISTDCVFSGDRGGYQETDIPDPVDLYGRSKLLGEVDEEGCITLRTSMIGLELANRFSLVEWALARPGPMSGYRKVLYSGLTTMELTRVIDELVVRHADLHGVWHVASEPISKYDLLDGLFRRIGRQGDVRPDDGVVSNRNMSGEAFEKATGYRVMSWDGMLDELATRIQERDTSR
ncbi:MAG: dTDP-4-dehydrorhamnose reductase family protein [Acidimicrobiales bacterium]